MDNLECWWKTKRILSYCPAGNSEARHVYIFFLGNVLYLVMLRKKEMSWFCIIIPIQYNTKKEYQDGEKVTDECVMQKISMMCRLLF